MKILDRKYKFDASEEEIIGYLQGIYTGQIDLEHLPENIYNKIAAYLVQGVEFGFGTPNLNSTMLNDLRTNVYIFSAAKTYHQTRDIMGALVTPEGTRTPYNEFVKKARDTFDEYNKNHLKTEFNSAVLQSENASHWERFIRDIDILPKLRYITVGDGRVRHEHAVLDGIVRPVNDSFWTVHMPQNDWNCRCTVQQEAATEKNTDLSKIDLPEIPPDFAFNPGIERKAFSPEHPYFTVEPRHIELAKRNFNLPIPKFEAPDMMPKKLLDYPVKLDANVFKMLKQEPKLILDGRVNRAYYSPSKDTVTIGKGDRWKRSDYQKAKVVYHEFGHAIHTQNGIITSTAIREDFKVFFDDCVKLVAGKEQSILNAAEKIWEDALRNRGAEFLSHHNLTTNDVLEGYGALRDTIGSLTRGKYGGGHDNYVIYNTGEKELFAHAMENFFLGNPVFKEVASELYTKTIEYIKTLTHE